MYSEVANNFNVFFAGVGESLANEIDSSGALLINDQDHRHESNFTLSAVTEHDLVRYVSSIRGGSAPGIDSVTADFLKDNIQILCKPLLHLVNLSLSQGIFPDDYKVAKIFPLYKSSDATNMSNYRPISLLCVFSKILEKIVKDQLINYLHDNQILCNNQYGFRRDKNISDDLFDVG